jgi:hypothetical protein
VVKLFSGCGDNQTDKIIDLNLKQISEVVPGIIALQELVIGLISCDVVPQ